MVYFNEGSAVLALEEEQMLADVTGFPAGCRGLPVPRAQRLGCGHVNQSSDAGGPVPGLRGVHGRLVPAR
jgi:hypothetical protein